MTYSGIVERVEVTWKIKRPGAAQGGSFDLKSRLRVATQEVSERRAGVNQRT